MRTVGVKENTYRRLKILRNKLHLRSFSDTIKILLDMYEDSLVSPNEILINLLTNVGQLLEKVDRLEKKISKLESMIARMREARVVPPESTGANTGSGVLGGSGSTIDTGGLPSYFRDNPWVQILSKRGRENLE